MTISPRWCVVLLGVASLAVSAARAAKVNSDIAPPEKRRATLEEAEKLAHRPATPPVAADLPQPFSPPGFTKPEAPVGGAAPDKNAAPVAAGPQTDREALEAVAAKIPTTGTIILGGKPLLISGVNRIEIGSHFTVVYGGQEYELELTAIDRTTFTVRYKGEEFTRPIKQGKSP